MDEIELGLPVNCGSPAGSLDAFAPADAQYVVERRAASAGLGSTAIKDFQERADMAASTRLRMGEAASLSDLATQRSTTWPSLQRLTLRQ